MKTKLASVDSKVNSYLITSLSIVTDAGSGFLELTGYSKDEIVGRNISEVFSSLLRLHKNKFEQIGIENNMECYIFTKALVAREVTISFLEGQDLYSIIYTIIEMPNSRLDDKLIFEEQLFKDNKVGCSIYSVPDLILLKSNHKYLDFMDRPYNAMEKCIGLSLWESIPGYKGSNSEELFLSIIKTGLPGYYNEFKYDHYDRGITYWDGSVVPIFSDSKVKYIYQTCTEVTDRVANRIRFEEQAKVIIYQNEQLKHQNNLLNRQANLLNLANEAIFIWDSHGSINYWNKGAEIMYGYSSEEAIGCRSHDLLKTVLHCNVKSYKLKLATDGVWHGEVEHVCKDGRKLIVETSQQVILDEFENKIVLETNRDVTQRKLAEEKMYWNKMKAEILCDISISLLASVRPLEIVRQLCFKVMAFLDCHAFFNYLIDEDLMRLHLNAYGGIPEEAAREIEWLDYGIAVCGCVARDGCRIVTENIQETSDTRTELVKAYGIRAYACHPLMEQGRVIGTLSFGTRSRDTFNEEELALMKGVAAQVSVAMNRIRMAESLKIQQQQYLEIEKEKNLALLKVIDMKDEFLSLISHEFKTPLTVINSAIQAINLICKNELSDKTKGFLQKINQNSNRQLKLVNNLLDITRANAGHLKLNLKNIDIIPLTRSITESISTFAENKGIKLSFSSTLGKKIIGIDEEKYERILLNLLSNAVKFTPKGKSISVNVSQKIVNRKCKVCVQVRDKGVGIPLDKKELIFERFGQVDNSLTRQAEGTGIGLYLVKMLVEMMCGEITLESIVGKGSTFSILLPTTKVKDTATEQMIQEISCNRLIQATTIEFSDVYM